MQRTDPEWVKYLKSEHARSDDPDYWQSLLRQISGMWYSVQDYSMDQLATISTPTLLFLGDRDELNDLEQNVAAYRHIPGAELAIVRPTLTTPPRVMNSPTASFSGSLSATVQKRCKWLSPLGHLHREHLRPVC